MGRDATILIIFMLGFKPAFHSSLSLSPRGSLLPVHFSPSSAYKVSALTSDRSEFGRTHQYLLLCKDITYV